MIQIFHLWSYLILHYIFWLYAVQCFIIMCIHTSSHISITSFYILCVRNWERSDILPCLSVDSLVYNHFIDLTEDTRPLGQRHKGLYYITAGSQHELHVCISFSCLLSPVRAMWGRSRWMQNMQLICVKLRKPQSFKNKPNFTPEGSIVFTTLVSTQMSRGGHCLCVYCTNVSEKLIEDKSQCLHSQSIQKLKRPMRSCLPTLPRTQQSRDVGMQQMLKRVYLTRES